MSKHGTIIKCSICGTAGHNKSGCGGNPEKGKKRNAHLTKTSKNPQVFLLCPVPFLFCVQNSFLLTSNCFRHLLRPHLLKHKDHKLQLLKHRDHKLQVLKQPEEEELLK
jgi:hypothetical protein